MSEETQYYLASGVFKFGHFSLGFPELKQIAEQWKEEDELFYSLIVRGVSDTNYGIDFTYYREFTSGEFYDVMKKHKEALNEKYGDGFYAWDFHKSSSTERSRFSVMLIKHDKLEIA